MIKCVFHHEFSFDKSPYVDDRSRLTVDGSDTFATVPLLQLIQSHINDRVVGIDIGGDRHPRAAEVLELEGSCPNDLLLEMAINTIKTSSQ